MLPRFAAEKIETLRQGFPIVAITGPRQSGKTTLAQACFDGYEYLNLEDLDLREEAESDPRGFLARRKSGFILDEAQRAPALFSYLQGYVDQRREMGQVVLTGSQNFLLLESITQSLAGRVALFELLPLSTAEAAPKLPKDLSLGSLIFQGLYPALYDRPLAAADWHSRYLQTYIERDVRQIKNISNIPNERSSHSIPTPRGGGIFIVVGTLLSLLVSTFVLGTDAILSSSIIGISIIATIGFIDDIRSLPSLLRLAGHVAGGAIILYWAFDYHSVGIAIGVALIGAIWLVGCLNIYNFMDGIDGIATCQGIVASIVLIVISRQEANLTSLVISASILGGLISFLFFNWSPAKVFMGDSASGMLGYSFAMLPIILGQGNLSTSWVFVNITALSLFPFLFDGAFTLIRRLIRKENVLEAHRSHLYQRWVQSGRSHRFVSTCYALAASYSRIFALLVYVNKISLPIAWILRAYQLPQSFSTQNDFQSENCGRFQSSSMYGLWATVGGASALLVHLDSSHWCPPTESF